MGVKRRGVNTYLVFLKRSDFLAELLCTRLGSPAQDRDSRRSVLAPSKQGSKKRTPSLWACRAQSISRYVEQNPKHELAEINALLEIIRLFDDTEVGRMCSDRVLDHMQGVFSMFYCRICIRATGYVLTS